MSDFVRRSVRAVVVNKDNQILFVQHAEARQYVLPGGGIDDGETEEQALNREMQEELGLSVNEATLLLRAQKIAKHSEDVVFMTSLASGPIHLNDESLDYIWVSDAEMTNYDIRPRHLGYAMVAVAELPQGA